MSGGDARAAERCAGALHSVFGGVLNALTHERSTRRELPNPQRLWSISSLWNAYRVGRYLDALCPMAA